MLDHDLLLKALNAAQQGQKYAFATIVEATIKGTPRKAGAKMVVLEDGSIYGTIGGGRNEKAAQAESLKAIQAGKPVMVTYDYFGGKDKSVCGGQIKVFIEPVVHAPHLVICGGGHIGLALSAIGKILDFKVTVIDNRKDFATNKRFPHVDRVVLGDYVKSLSKLSINENTYIMIVTQGNEGDFKSLAATIKSKAAYIGVISSKAKRIKFFSRLKKGGISEKMLKNIHIPAGLDLGGQSPAEIAVSIMSEMLLIKNKDLVGTMKFKEKSERVSS